MRSSTKSESNGNTSDNMNNNTIEVDDERDKRSADDVIDVASSETVKLHNQAGNSESELTQRAEHADNDKSAKINVYEQVNLSSLNS